MHRLAALRAAVIFALATLLFATLGLAQHSPLAEAGCLISGSLAAVMILFGLTAPAPAPALARVRRNRR